MDRIHDILDSVNKTVTDSAQKTYKGQKRSDLKDSDFLFPETRSFPIVSPQDIKDAISNFGRMKSNMSYDAFLKKLYNMAKRKGPAFVAALPKSSKEKLGLKTESVKQPINKMYADTEDENPPVKHITLMNNMEDDFPNPIDEDVMEGKCLCENSDVSENFDDEALSMILSSLKNIATNIIAIIKNSDIDRVKENLTEPWVLGIISVVENNVTTVHDFVKFSDEQDDTSDAGSKPGLWDNIRKKKQREGKNYRPAKPGDKDRPDSDQWKKLTK